MRRRECVIQAGAHVGYWPAYLSVEFARVVSFEAVLSNWRCATEAQVGHDVLIFPAAVSDHIGTVNIGALDPEKELRFSGSGAVNLKGREVACVTLDSLPRWMTDKVGLIVLDIEGHEMPALYGAVRLLSEFHPVITIEENAKSLRHREAGAAEHFLAAHGYTYRERVGSDLIFT